MDWENVNFVLPSELSKDTSNGCCKKCTSRLMAEARKIPRVRSFLRLSSNPTYRRRHPAVHPV